MSDLKNKDFLNNLKKLSGLNYDYKTTSDEQEQLNEQVEEVLPVSEGSNTSYDPNLKAALDKTIRTLHKKAESSTGRMKEIWQNEHAQFVDIREAVLNNRTKYAKQFFDELDNDAKSLLSGCCNTFEQENIVRKYFGMELLGEEEKDEKNEAIEETTDEQDEKGHSSSEDESPSSQQEEIKEEYDFLSYDEASPNQTEEKPEKIKIPTDVMRDLKAVVKDCYTRSEFYKEEDLRQSEFFERAGDALQFIVDCLNDATEARIKEATLHMTSLMGPIADKIPSSVRLFLSSGEPEKTLKDYFNDSRNKG